MLIEHINMFKYQLRNDLVHYHNLVIINRGYDWHLCTILYLYINLYIQLLDCYYINCHINIQKHLFYCIFQYLNKVIHNYSINMFYYLNILYLCMIINIFYNNPNYLYIHQVIIIINTYSYHYHIYQHIDYHKLN